MDTTRLICWMYSGSLRSLMHMDTTLLSPLSTALPTRGHIADDASAADTPTTQTAGISPSIHDEAVLDATQKVMGEAAFKLYVEAEIPVLFGVARSLTRNASDAEDLVQETLIRAYRAIDRFDGRYPRAWLLTILRNANINNARKKRPELMWDPDLTMEKTADTEIGDGDVSDLVVRDQFDADIETALDELSPKYRAAVEQVDILGLPYAEAAVVLGVPIGTLMSRLHRARKNLRSALESSGRHSAGT